MIHIMLDLETWGTRPGCDIRSIGACVFEPVSSRVGFGTNHEDNGTFYIACDNPGPHHKDDNGHLYGSLYDDGNGTCRKYPLHRDPQTVQWWNAPEQAAASTAFDNPVDLREALVRFGDWLGAVSTETGPTPHPSVRLWSHGPAFDPPILAEAYHAVGLPVPWHYRAPRDTRTLFDVAGIEDHSAWLDQHPGPMGVPHHALDDAICQAQAVCAAWGRAVR